MGHDFNPRSPDGERQSGLLVLGLAVDISIHAPRMGSDQVRLVSRQSLKDFNPRSPDGERPNQLLTNPSSQGISIHAPRMGSDAGLALGGDTWPHISIHAPRMGSDSRGAHRAEDHRNFNPRSPDGERPSGRRLPDRRQPISIHAPRMGSDSSINKTGW